MKTFRSRVFSITTLRHLDGFFKWKVEQFQKAFQVCGTDVYIYIKLYMMSMSFINETAKWHNIYGIIYLCDVRVDLYSYSIYR